MRFICLTNFRWTTFENVFLTGILQQTTSLSGHRIVEHRIKDLNQSPKMHSSQQTGTSEGAIGRFRKSAFNTLSNANGSHSHGHLKDYSLLRYFPGTSICCCFVAEPPHSGANKFFDAVFHFPPIDILLRASALPLCECLYCNVLGSLHHVFLGHPLKSQILD